MKKLLIRIGMVLVMLVVLNWVYAKWFFEKDLRKHSDIVELSWQVTDDSCRIIYLGESSNNHYGDEELNHRKISDFTSDYFPTVKMGDLTKSASHAQTYYYMLKHIPASSAVETVVVTMNLRSFGPLWIYSKLETALRKQLVLLEDYPPLVNRFLLAFKAYPIKTEDEWDELVFWHWRNDTINMSPSVAWRTTADWDYGMYTYGWYDANGQRDWDMTALACHYIKTYSFQIADDNPRVKDFDAIVDLCRERGWNLVFNLMAENVDKANELVGKDLMLLFKYNRDFLLQRYGNIEGVTVVNNLNLVRDVNFIDQDWTTEHYYEEGRRIIADHLASALREFYPDDYHNPDSLKMDKGHYFFGDTKALDEQRPYGSTLVLTADSISPEWSMVNVAFEIQQNEHGKAVFAVEKHGFEGEIAIDSYAVNAQVNNTGAWNFATVALPLDSAFRSAQKVKLYIYNFSGSPVQIRNFDISFRPAYLKARVKAQSYKSTDLNDGE